MRSVETTAKTRQEAIKKALEELGAELHEVQIEILDEGSRGIFGIGARDVKVKLTLEKDVPTRRGADRDRDHDKDRERPRSDRERDRDRGDRDRDRDRGRRGERPATREERPARPERPAAAREERPARPERGPSPERPPRPDRGPRPERPPRPERAERPQSPQRPERPQRPTRHEPREARPEPAATESPRAVSETPAPVREDEREMASVSDARREEAASLLAEVVSKMGIEAQVTSSLTEDGRARVNVESPDSAILIGRKGRNLQALQYLLNRMMRPGEGETVERFIVDIESYLDRRRENLEEMARHLAERAKETGRDVRVKPLSPQERRIIHLTLQDDPDVRTFSLGTSSIRTVVISPKNAARTGSRTGDHDAGRDSGRPRRPRGGRGRRNGRVDSSRSSSEPAAVATEDEDIVAQEEARPLPEEDIITPDEDILGGDEDVFGADEEAGDSDAQES